ncbi:hypothetical protein KTQ42_01845|uniref:hypothetical protein n=1 Tax=Noviherbaspirillum sp. L7-7A TaxID=2850560 RepID=UPI001C2CB9CD|nr:hypothetical protein [Noviherbaspirillum sp. L7-7A]MBV0878045.1 hypothetical protein [Noviherbaspirillum sp. L7-7A]
MKLILPICCIALLSLLSFPVARGHAGVLAKENFTEYGPYVGKLGDRELVARFKSNARGVPMSGSYFYRDTGREVLLVYAAAQQRFIECMPTWREEESGGCSEPSGYWIVQIMRNGALVDWRAKPDDQPLKALLSKADKMPGAADVDAQVGVLQLAGSRVVGIEQGRGAVRWRMVTEPRSKVSMPFLTKAPVGAALRRINANIEQQFQWQISEVLYNTSRVGGEAEFYNTAFVTGTRYFAVGEGVYAYVGGAHSNFNFSATTFDLKTGKLVNLAKRYHIYPFRRSGMKTAGLSLMEQARAQHQTSAFSNQKTSYWKGGIDCWGTGQDTDVDDGSDPDGMTDAAEQVPEESTRWIVVFPTADGLAVADTGIAEFMRYCRGDYRVIPWSQAALARRLPTDAGHHAAPKAQAPANQSGASCPR